MTSLPSALGFELAEAPLELLDLPEHRTAGALENNALDSKWAKMMSATRASSNQATFLNIRAPLKKSAGAVKMSRMNGVAG